MINKLLLSNVLFRLIWIFCVTAAMILFVYQVADRTFVYFDYNTTVSVDIRYLDEVPFPAVTLCNINTFRLEGLDSYQCHIHWRICWGRPRRPRLRPKIFSISCRFFWQNLAKSYVGAPPKGLAPPPTGNPGSASDIR